VEVWHGKKETPVARARAPRTGELSDFTTLTSRALGAAQSTLCAGGCDRKKNASATCSSQFAKASAAMLPQQEKNNSADVQLGIVNIFGFILTVESYSSRRRTFDDFLSLAVALR
jgi:hypothetical protein